MDDWIDSDIKSKRKKLAKKVQKGEVHTRLVYNECLALGIKGKPQLSVVEDKSRKHAKYNLRLQDVRDLISSVLFDRCVPKQFQVKNKPFIQNVIVVHVSNCESHLPILDEIGATESYSVRISNVAGKSISLPEKLLSLSIDEIDQNEPVTTENIPGFEYYVINEAMMRLWGYPLPIDQSASTIDESPSKRARRADPIISMVSSPIIGLKSGSCPSIEETTAMFEHADELLRYITVIDKDNQASSTGYLQTISSSSQHHLYPPSSTTSSSTSSSTSHNLIAIDCEMCITSEGSCLTRITMIDQYNRILLDSYVQPSSPITDYLSPYSGITAAHLDGVNITLQQVQLAFLRLVHAETILIGHSLDNDLRALKITHTRCIDTALLYPHMKGYPYRHKLKYLAQEYLKIKIQQHVDGHDSIEDARTAMQLVVMKQEQGPSFGVTISSDRHPLLSAYKLPESSSGAHINGRFYHNEVDEAKVINSTCVPSNMPDIISSTHSSIDEMISTYTSDMTADISSTSSSMRFIYVGINHELVSSNLIANMKDVIKQVKLAASSHPSLLVITTQPSIASYETLKKRKKACQSPQVMAVWTPELELQLREILSVYHTGRVYLATI